MSERIHIDLEEGERHPSESHALHEIVEALIEQAHTLVRIERLLLELLRLDTPQTYLPTTGGTIAVTE